MNETIKKTDHQFYIFVAGIIIFGIIAVLGWVKLQYGFTFMDESYHMIEGWRLSSGDHFIHDTPNGALRNYRLLNKLIFDVCPDITLLGFRKLQFFLTLISLFIFGSSLYRFNKQYWYLPFIFSIFAFTGLDPLGATSNLNYYTYPHLFVVLHIAFLLFGVRAKNSIIKLLLFLFSGICLWLISLSLLHLSPIIAAPIGLYLFAKFFHFKQIKFQFKDLALVLVPFFSFWAVFLMIYNIDFIHSVLTSLKMITEYPSYSSEFIRINWTVLSYTMIMFILASAFLMVLRTFKPHKIIYLIFLSILAFWIIDTSLFGIIYPYWKDWYSRPMWFAGMLISFHLFFWVHILTKQFLFKHEIKPNEELAILLMLPATLLFIPAATFSTFGAILILHCAIPTVTALTIVIINLEQIKLRSNAFKLIILVVAFAPFYYTTAWSDWNFTYCDVKPKDANAEITEGFLKGIHTNGIYKQINDWITKNTATYSNDDDFIISYILTPMVYMIAERRPSIEQSFLNPPDERMVKHYKTMIDKMLASKRNPAIAFVFDNTPALNTINEKSKIRFNLKGEKYSFYGPWYNFGGSQDALAGYIKNNMTMVDSITYQNHTAQCFVDKKKFAEKSLTEAVSELEKKIIQQPENVLLYYKMGLLFEQNNNLKKAAHAYQKSLALQPDAFQTLNRLTMIYIKEKRYTDAISLLSGPMIKLQPNNADIYYNIACLFAIQNDQEKAIEWLDRALEKGYNKWEKIKTDLVLENIRNSIYYQETIKNHQ